MTHLSYITYKLYNNQQKIAIYPPFIPACTRPTFIVSQTPNCRLEQKLSAKSIKVLQDKMWKPRCFPKCVDATTSMTNILSGTIARFLGFCIL